MLVYDSQPSSKYCMFVIERAFVLGVLCRPYIRLFHCLHSWILVHKYKHIHNMLGVVEEREHSRQLQETNDRACKVQVVRRVGAIKISRTMCSVQDSNPAWGSRQGREEGGYWVSERESRVPKDGFWASWRARYWAFNRAITLWKEFQKLKQ